MTPEHVPRCPRPKGWTLPGIRWDDPELAVRWPIRDPVVSNRDKGLGSFADYKAKPPRFVVAANSNS